jgi:hypothetical protein
MIKLIGPGLCVGGVELTVAELCAHDELAVLSEILIRKGGPLLGDISGVLDYCVVHDCLAGFRFPLELFDQAILDELKRL